MKRPRMALFFLIVALSIFCFCGTTAYAAALPFPNNIGLNIGVTEDPQSVVSSLQILFLLAIITLIPTLLIMLTCFTRIIIVLHFARSALGTQQMPPNQILVGLALFLTLFLMGPTISIINETALQPYTDGQISQAQALDSAMRPIREYMLLQCEDKDMALFVELSGQTFATIDEIPNRVIIPAYILGELTKGFQIGFYIYLPFIIIDMVVASTLMAMGMMMLPPAMISLPFKILIFVLADGWSLLLESLVRTFR